MTCRLPFRLISLVCGIYACGLNVGEESEAKVPFGKPSSCDK